MLAEQRQRTQPANVTLSAWVNLTGVDTNGAEVISLGDHLTLRLFSNGLYGSMWNGSSYNTVFASATMLNTGWHQVAVSFDNASKALDVYLDGNVVATATASHSIGWTGLGANSFIGKQGNGATNCNYTGLIDDARIYSRVLTAGEVAALASDLSHTHPASVATTVNAVADTPSVTNATTNEDAQSSSGLVICEKRCCANVGSKKRLVEYR